MQLLCWAKAAGKKVMIAKSQNISSQIMQIDPMTDLSVVYAVPGGPSDHVRTQYACMVVVLPKPPIFYFQMSTSILFMGSLLYIRITSL